MRLDACTRCGGTSDVLCWHILLYDTSWSAAARPPSPAQPCCRGAMRSMHGCMPCHKGHGQDTRVVGCGAPDGIVHPRHVHPSCSCLPLTGLLTGRVHNIPHFPGAGRGCILLGLVLCTYGTGVAAGHATIPSLLIVGYCCPEVSTMRVRVHVGCGAW